MNKQKHYRRVIRRKLFWQKNGKKILAIGIVSILLLTALAFLSWKVFFQGKDQDGQVSQDGQGGQVSQVSQDGQGSQVSPDSQGGSDTAPGGEGQGDSGEDALLSLADQEPSQPLCIAAPEKIPEYAGENYVILNENVPEFNRYDLEHVIGENFSELDSLGRCGPAMAMLHRSMMPTEKRGSIGSIKPTGWVQNKYEGIVDSNPPYLYNRCHLIAFALTGQNANEKNLITGTRYFNAKVMLSWESKVMSYLEKNDSHVLYRVTPYFVGEELLSRGVEIEAYSVEDKGEGVCYHVFLYNVQPGVEIDYATGENYAAQKASGQ